MRSTRKSTIIVVGGALAVASVGYGLGTQADDGTAVAGAGQATSEDNRNGAPPAFRDGAPPPGFSALADKLGVDADELGKALRDFRESGGGDRRDEFAAALAKELGISAEKVTAAFEGLREKHEARPERGGRNRQLPLRALASALDVTRDDLRKALRDLRAGAEKGRRQHDQALAKFLADRFDLTADDVAKALEALPRPVRPDHGGRPGPGGPGPGRGFGGPGPALDGPGPAIGAPA